MQKILTELLESINGGAPENTPPVPSIEVVGGGGDDFAYGKVTGTIPVTSDMAVKPYVIANTYTGINEFGILMVLKL